MRPGSGITVGHRVDMRVEYDRTPTSNALARGGQVGTTGETLLETDVILVARDLLGGGFPTVHTKLALAERPLNLLLNRAFVAGDRWDTHELLQQAHGDVASAVDGI